MSLIQLNDPTKNWSITANYMNGTYGNGIILDASGVTNVFGINFRTNGNIRVQITDSSTNVLNNLVANNLYSANITGACSQLSNIVAGKNLIINGACEIDQRFVGTSYTPLQTNLYTIDRWQALLTQASKFSVQKNAGGITGPPGFPFYLGVTSLSAYSGITTSDYFGIQQYIEGFNFAPLGWGTSSAKPVSLSFYVYSSQTGTFGGSLYNIVSSNARSYVFSYTISLANTWTYITIPNIPGDGAAGAGYYDASYGIGCGLFFSLGCGSNFQTATSAWATGASSSNFGRTITGETRIVTTNAATFYITGIQLEQGIYNTTFSRAGGSIQQELALCQRYFWAMPNYNGSGTFNGTQYAGAQISYNGTSAWVNLTSLNTTPMRYPPNVGQNPNYPIASYPPYTTTFGANAAIIATTTYSGPTTAPYGTAPQGLINFGWSTPSLTSNYAYGLNLSDPGRTLWLNSELTNGTLVTYSTSSLVSSSVSSYYLDAGGNYIGPTGSSTPVIGGYTVLVFKSSGATTTGTLTFTPNFTTPSIQYLGIAGGGGGGRNDAGGGGGAGGLLTGTTSVSSGTGYSLQIGGGGAGGGPSSPPGVGVNGTNTTFLGFTCVGGGGGGSGNNGSPASGQNGGSGGGASPWVSPSPAPGTGYGTGTSGQGNRGGTSWPGGGTGSSGGGGGAGGQGQDMYSIASVGGYGGVGAATTLIPTSLASAASVGQVVSTSVYFGGGGGGGADGPTASPYNNVGGYGGGGNGGYSQQSGSTTPYSGPTSATANTGGGGGGCGGYGVGGITGGSGGSGVIILRFSSYQ